MPNRAARGTWKLGPTTKQLEVLGAPSVTVQATASGGWPRLVAVLTAASVACDPDRTLLAVCTAK